MKTLLRIDASLRTSGSYTRTLTDHFQARWESANPTGSVIRRCLAKRPVPHLSQEVFEACQRAPGPKARRALSDKLIAELRTAHHVLIGSPLYNLTLPSTLKAYFDHVVRSGATFEVGPGGCRGLLNGKSATVITARGGIGKPTHADNFQTAYLKTILAFMGIEPIHVIELEGTAADEEAAGRALSYARQQVNRLFDHTALAV